MSVQTFNMEVICLSDLITLEKNIRLPKLRIWLELWMEKEHSTSEITAGIEKMVINIIKPLSQSLPLINLLWIGSIILLVVVLELIHPNKCLRTRVNKFLGGVPLAIECFIFVKSFFLIL